MPTLTIKNIPRDLHMRLKKHAKLRHRSMNSEVIDFVRLGLQRERFDPEQYLAEVDVARERLAAETGVFVTDDDIREGKNWGRM